MSDNRVLAGTATAKSGTAYAAETSGTNGNDYIVLTEVSIGGPIQSLVGGLGYDTVDASRIFAGAGAMSFRCLESDANFAGNGQIRFADYAVTGFEVIIGSNLGRNSFFIADYNAKITLIGGQYDDFFFGSFDFADKFYGRGGNDRIYVGNGDSAYGEAGDDSFSINGYSDAHIDGGAGTDLVEAGFGVRVDLSNNSITRSYGNTSYIVDVENVEVAAWYGYATSVIGDEMANHISVSDVLDDGSVGVTFDGRGGNDLLEGSTSGDQISGGLGNDLLFGFGGNDELFGGGGWDTLDGGAGNDLLDGGNGNDRASYLSAWSGVTVSLALEGAQNTQKAGWDTLVSIEDLTGSAFADTLTGSDGDNQIFGAGGADHVLGGFGDDLLLGQDGDDVIEGQAGWDFLRGDDGDDTLIGGNGGDMLLGGDGIDTLSGNSGFDRIYGGSGRDFISGGADRDLLFGEAGDDTISGDGGNDLLLGNNGEDVLDGGAGNDTINGGAGNDTLIGGDGDDILIGNWGTDTMTGGAGADSFVFKGGHTGSYENIADTILDFSHGDGDIIDLSQIDAIAGGGDDAFAFIGDAAFSGTAGELRFTATENGLMVEGDTDGDGVADLLIAVDGLADLTSADFVF